MPELTEQELMEKIAGLAFQYAFLIDDKYIEEQWRQVVNKEKWLDCAAQVLALLKPRYVELAEDQNLPEVPLTDYGNEPKSGLKEWYRKGQQDMLKQGWRKVKQ